MQLQDRKQFLNWDESVACMARRAAPKRADGVKPWVQGWNETLNIVAAHVRTLPDVKRTARSL